MKGLKKWTCVALSCLTALTATGLTACNALMGGSNSSDSSSSTSSEVRNPYAFLFENAIGLSVQITKATEEEYILDDGDDWSFSYKPIGTWTFWRFKDSNKIEWSKLKELKFSVYNPNYEYDYTFTVSLSETLDLSHDVRSEKFGSVYKAMAGEWTEFSISGEAAQKVFEKGYTYLSMAMSYPTNGGAGSEQWSQAQLYFDGFELIYKD